MSTFVPASALPVSEVELAVVEAARSTIDAATDAGPDEDGIHTVGAAVRSADGTIHVGVNLHHFTGGPCAELVALGAARASGTRELTHIVAVGNHGRGVMSPCRRDRQVLADHYPDIRVILPSPGGLISVTARELLPLAYDHAAQQV
ncbi:MULTISPECIES: cytidine deaminase family protein [unclassified Pseudoclavibacter]|uniref:cytidine deaminase family protein n=1 Tax=unclassified Pseudoclavibacter TaxID=2615177 RepID=UPI001BAD356D|nr:cytidine deaminase [Pseudoclavibacter sp. Marseille-Q4354]MBS3179662.1 cytidine deaminase [Pseudoclavibacter sp. Marseille-Q4354]